MNPISVAPKYSSSSVSSDRRTPSPELGVHPDFIVGGAKKAAVEAGSNADILGKAVFRKRKTMTELIVDAPLTGPVSFSFLEKAGFTQVDTIRLAPGQASQLVDVPQTVRRIFATKNQITEIDDLPTGVERLELSNNRIDGQVNIARYSMLTHLDVAHNQITGFRTSHSSSHSSEHAPEQQLPSSLVELIANHNQISSIYLGDVPLLLTLDLEYNPDLTVFDLPDGITNLVLPAVYTHRSRTQTQSRANRDKDRDQTPLALSKEPEVDPVKLAAYKAALLGFFQTRKAYETKAAKSKSGKRPPCPGCERTGGVVFSSRNQKHRAYCGNSPPCDWHITVSRGEFHPVREVMAGHVQNLETTRDHIIRQKMDTLFEYITEEKSAELFELQMGYYRDVSKLAEQYTGRWNAAFWNEAKAEVVHQKKKQVQALLAEADAAVKQKNWAEAVRIQVDQVAPIARYIQSLQYESSSSEMFGDGTVRITQLAVTPERAEANVGHPVM